VWNLVLARGAQLKVRSYAEVLHRELCVLSLLSSGDWLPRVGERIRGGCREFTWGATEARTRSLTVTTATSTTTSSSSPTGWPAEKIKNRMLRKILWPKRDKVTGDWRRLHNEELCGLCSSSNVIRVVKSRTLRWIGHVERIEGSGEAKWEKEATWET